LRQEKNVLSVQKQQLSAKLIIRSFTSR